MYTFSKSFANLDEFRRYLETAPVNKTAFYSLHSETQTEQFTGTRSYTAADLLLRDGDEENAKKLRAAVGTGVNSAPWDGTRVRRFSAVCGGVANVPATVLGLPKSMIRTQKITYKDSKVISLIYNISIDCTVKSDEINKVSAALVSAVLGLEKKGYRINLYVCECAYRGAGRNKETLAGFIRIKDSGQYMDLKKMSYPLVNPSMLRRHFFAYTERVPGLTPARSWQDTYGTPIRDAAEVTDLAKSAGLRAGKVVSFYDIRHKGTDEIIKAVLS